MSLKEKTGTEEKIVEIVGEFTSASFDELKNKTLDEAEIDSLAKAEILFRLEDEFNINIEDELLQNVNSLPDLVKVVETKISEK